MEKDELIKRVEELQRENRRLEEVLERNGLNDSIKDKKPLAGIENRLKEREAFFRDIAESMSDIMWEIDSEWRYTFVAGKLEKYIGYTPDDLIGITPFDLMAEEESDAFLRVLKDASLELRPITDVEATVKSLDGKDSTFLVNAVPVIRDGVFAGYRGVVREISELKKFHDELELLVSERTSEIMKLNSMLLTSQEEERQRIAKDLHDGVGQTILAAKFAFSSFMKSKMKDHDVFDRGMLLIDMSSQELREVYSGLYPSMLRELGLGSTVKWCIRNYLESAGISVDYYVNIESAVGHQIAINVYRIMQELFNNIVKHSGAVNARVAVFDSQECIKIEVEDDGGGFNRESVMNNASGSGLFNIGQRISLLNGKLDIDSGSGYTSVRIEIPLEKK